MLYIANWKERVYSFSAKDTDDEFFLTDFHEKKHKLIVCDEFDFDNIKDMNKFKKLIEGIPLQIKQKYNSKYVEKTIQLPMIFITNCLNICGIQSNKESSQCVANIFNEDDDTYRKGLRERLKLILADRNIFYDGKLIYEFTNDYVFRMIKFSYIPVIQNELQMIDNDMLAI